MNSVVRTVNSVFYTVNSDFGFSGFFGSLHGSMYNTTVISGFVCWVFAIINIYLLYAWRCDNLRVYTNKGEQGFKGIRVSAQRKSWIKPWV